MSQLGLQIIIVVAFGALCFGVGYLTASIVTRNRWRDEMIKRGFARYNWYTGKWEWENHRKNRVLECPPTASRRPGRSFAKHSPTMSPPNWLNFAYSTRRWRAWVRGQSKMREYEYVACPCCGETMQLARTAFHAELSLETFECKPCGLAVTAEAVSRTHVLIEERYC